jgi:hypothetical protein
MSKKIILVFVICFFFSACHLVFANFNINEVMYDLEGTDTGREWVEIYNNSGADVDLSTFKFFEGNTNHGLTLVQGNKNVNAHGYAVIVSDYAKFKIDWPNFSGTIFDSTFSLSNDGEETLAIKDENLNVVDEFTYNSGMGANGDGNSLQKISGSWIPATPTPGKINESVSTIASQSNSESSSAQNIIAEAKTKVVEEPKIKTSITIKGSALAGMPVEFQGNAFGYSGEKLLYGRYFWNFGDGDSKEVKMNDINAQKFTHIYFYPGEYVVSLEYYLNYYGNAPDAFNKMTIRVTKADIVISRVGDEKDFFVELSNNAEYDIDISNWILSSNGKNFSIPRNTTIRAEKKMIISSKITSFSIYDKNNLKLLSPQGEVVFDYGSSVFVPASNIKTKTITQLQPEMSTNQNQTNKGLAIKPSEISTPTEENQISAESLLPSVISGDSVVKNNQIRVYILAFILTIFVGGSALAVYLIRQKRVVSGAGDDFKILDE